MRQSNTVQGPYEQNRKQTHGTEEAGYHIPCVIPTELCIYILRCARKPGHGHQAHFLFFRTLLLSSFYTSRGHRCRPFSPRFLPSICTAHRVQQSHSSSVFHRAFHALALPQVNLCTRKSPYEFIRVWTPRDSNSRNRPIPDSRIT